MMNNFEVFLHKLYLKIYSSNTYQAGYNLLNDFNHLSNRLLKKGFRLSGSGLTKDFCLIFILKSFLFDKLFQDTTHTIKDHVCIAL